MEILAEYSSVILISMFRLYIGAGLSFAYGHAPLEQWLLMGSGSVAGVSLCLFLGSKIEKWWLQKIARRKKGGKAKASNHPSLIERIWQRYGLLGLAASTIFMGTIPSVAIALVSGLDRKRIFLYLSGGKIVLGYIDCTDW